MRLKIARVLNGVNMAWGHDRLMLEIKKQAEIDVRVLPTDSVIMCINRAGDKAKAVAGGGVVYEYLKMPKGRKLMKEAIQYMGKVFGGDGFTYDDACKEALAQIQWRKQYLPERFTKTSRGFVKTFTLAANNAKLAVKEAASHAE